MTEDQIVEIFIRAAETDRKLPNTARPATLKAANHGYVHDTADMNGWSAEDKHAANWAWLDQKNLRNTTNDMGIWVAAMEIIKLCQNESQRRALWAWARSEAGGKAFAKWCRVEEGISRQLGLWRKDAAISTIVAAFARKVLQHNENDPIAGFTNGHEIGDKSSNIAVWRPDESKPVCGFDEELQDFSWVDAQNAKRRAKYAKRRAA